MKLSIICLCLILTLAGCTSNDSKVVKMSDGRYKIECEGLAPTSGLNPTVTSFGNTVIIQYGIGSYGLIISKNCLVEQISLR